VNDKTKLHLALIQVQNILSLVKGNQYESFLNKRMIEVHVELQRQLTNIQTSSKIKE
jgi:hypothetical protein